MGLFKWLKKKTKEFDVVPELLKLGGSLLPPQVSFLTPLVTSVLIELDRKEIKLDEKAVVDIVKHTVEGHVDVDKAKEVAKSVEKKIKTAKSKLELAKSKQRWHDSLFRGRDD